MATSVLDTRREAAAAALATTVSEIETFLREDAADPGAPEFVALRERRDTQQATLADLLASLEARRMAAHRPAVEHNGAPLSDMRRVLREYDRGMSERFAIEYVLRELQTGDPMFTPNPTRIQVAQLPIITPSLDVVNTVATGNNYDFVIPPHPAVPSVSVPEGGQKPTVPFASTQVSGSLETDALIVDASRQALEDDASAESTLRAWLTAGIRLRQDAKCQAAIAGASGTQTAGGISLIEAVRNGKAVLSGLGVMATAVYMHHLDAAAMDLDVMVRADQSPVGQSSVWGMRVIESPAIPQGVPVVGAIGQAVYMLYRSAISTYLTDSGMTDETTPRDRFSHNLLGILAEGRSKVHVVAPELLVKCTVAP